MDYSDEDLLSFLSTHIPSKSQEIASSCVQSVDELRIALLKIERTISLIPLLSAPSYPTTLIPDRCSVLDFILSPYIMQTKDMSPLFVQHASLFVNFMYNKPSLFAKVVCKRYGQQDFHFMVCSVIPSFFGFFATAEHISISTVFYQHVVKIAPPQVAIDVIQPLFCSLCTFKFVEDVMLSFCSKFGVENRLDDPKRQAEMIPLFVAELMSLIQSKLSLLPSVIILLFNTMITMNWSLRYLIDMFFSHFFNHQSIAWIASSPFSHRVPIFQKIISTAIENAKLMRDVLKSFLITNSLFEIPFAYRSFNEDYIQVLVSVSDIMCAARCFNTEDELPFSLRGCNYESFPMEKRFVPIQVRVFVKHTSQNFEDESRLIFSKYQTRPIDGNTFNERIYRQLQVNIPLNTSSIYNMIVNGSIFNYIKVSQESLTSRDFLNYALISSLNQVIRDSDAFENMLIFRTCFEELKKWNEIAKQRQITLMTPMALKAAKTAVKIYSDNASKAYSKASHNFSSKELKKIQFYTVVMPTISDALETRINKFGRLEKLWSIHLKDSLEKADTHPVSSLPNTSQYIFWECVEEIRTLGHITISRQFDMLSRVINKIYMIAKDRGDIILLVIIFSENPKIPAICLVSNVFIVNSPVMQGLMSQTSKRRWDSFHEVLKKQMKDCEAGALYNTLLSDLEGTYDLVISPDSDSNSSSWFYDIHINEINKINADY